MSSFEKLSLSLILRIDRYHKNHNCIGEEVQHRYPIKVICLVFNPRCVIISFALSFEFSKISKQITGRNMNGIRASLRKNSHCWSIDLTKEWFIYSRVNWLIIPQPPFSILFSAENADPFGRQGQSCSSFSKATRVSFHRTAGRKGRASTQQVSSNFRSTAPTMKRKTTDRHCFTPG